MLAVSLAAFLPALLLVAAALGLWWLLARWYDAPPAWVLALFVLSIALLLAPSLASGRIALPLHLLATAPPFEHLMPADAPDHLLQHDLLLEELPWQLAVRGALARGEWPLWDQDMGAGLPLLADAQVQAQAFQPITAPALLVV